MPGGRKRKDITRYFTYRFSANNIISKTNDISQLMLIGVRQVEENLQKKKRTICGDRFNT
jgi:hypothetical protein